MPRKTVRVGDTVRFVNPRAVRVVQRVGYPLDVKQVAREISDDQIDRALDAAFGIPMPASPPKVRLSMARALAYAWAHSQGFGGAVRSVHFHTEESLRGLPFLIDLFADFTVAEITHHMIGERYPGYIAGEFGEEWRPPGLEKTRRVSVLRPYLGCEYGFLAEDVEIVTYV